jgi:hypothetical protein
MDVEMMARVTAYEGIEATWSRLIPSAEMKIIKIWKNRPRK